MMRQSSSRNQRYKGGFRFRHFFQLCLLLATCIWLVYQVKHSHEKKRAFVERKDVEEQPFSFPFGRKELPTVMENDLMRETHDVDEDEVESREGEVQEQEMKDEDAQDEERNGDADDWTDEQDLEQRGMQNDQEVEFKNEEENKILVRHAESVDGLERQDSVLDAREANNKRDNVSQSVPYEIHMTETETARADSGGFDVENPDVLDANKNGNSSILAVGVSDNSSNNGGLNALMSNLSSISLRENTTHSEASIHFMNDTTSGKSESVIGVFKRENCSISSPVSAEENNHNIVKTNTTKITLPVVTDFPTVNASESLMETAATVAVSLSSTEIIGNETASLISVDQRHTSQDANLGENHSHLVDVVVEFEHNLKPKASEESENRFATTSFNKEVNLSHNAVTKQEMEARTDLSTLPEIKNAILHDHDETKE